MCENHDSLSHRSISDQRRLHSPSGDEQETELEPSLEQDEDDKDQDQSQEELEKDFDGNVSPSRKKEIKVNVRLVDCKEILLNSVWTFNSSLEYRNSSTVYATNIIPANSGLEKNNFVLICNYLQSCL